MLHKFGLVETTTKRVKVGDTFGRLEVIAIGVTKGTPRYKAICKCSCDSEIKAIRFDALLNGFTQSCGCLQKERTTTHGLTNSVHYSRWHNMIDRCENTENHSYSRYGGRGIKVCEKWHDLKNFVADLPDGYEDGLEMDRVNNEGDYEPNNIRWVSKSKNCDNRCTGNIIEFNGKKQSLTRWAEEMGIRWESLYARIYISKWAIEKALTAKKMSLSEAGSRGCAVRWNGHIAKKKPLPRVFKTINFEGKQVTMSELSKITGITVKLLRKRIFERKWSIEKATSVV
jgi:hypothetical protein